MKCFAIRVLTARFRGVFLPLLSDVMDDWCFDDICHLFSEGKGKAVLVYAVARFSPYGLHQHFGILA